MENTVLVGTIDTPFGRYGAAISPVGLGRLIFPNDPLVWCEEWAKKWWPDAKIVHEGEALDRLAQELNAYFEGKLRDFTIPLDMRGTPFQLEVWKRLLDIGYGEIRSYMQLANQLGKPLAVRAVGTANGANPVPILVPCHRVIGSGGGLTGYGGGLELKQKLLQHEGALML